MFAANYSAKTAAAADDNTITSTHHGIVPLSTWMEFIHPRQQSDNNNNSETSFKETIIRKTTVTYGIVELLKRSKKLRDDEIRIDNFVVTVLKQPSRSWDDVKGVGMISSGLSLMIEEPSYLSALLEEEDDGGEDSNGRIIGRCLEVESVLTTTPPADQEKNNNDDVGRPEDAETGLRGNVWKNYTNHLSGMNALAAVAEESNRCHLFARLLYELFTHEPFPTSKREPPQKRAKPSYHEVISGTWDPSSSSHNRGDFVMSTKPFQIPCIVRMQKLGIPASICLMTQNLLEYALRGSGRQSDDAYESLGVVCEDVQLLLLDPDRFLFDNDHSQNTDDDMQLLYRKEKLYGRDKEETLITDAFCRVTRGKSEAFFIGGFSGSGKSMLVDSLRDRVNAVGGYVTKHKFDVMSQEEPLSGVISAFNQICQMIQGRARPVIAKRLCDEFGSDFGLLVRLLPSVGVLFPNIVIPSMQVVEDAVTMNARSVSFTLLRFVRVVSSPSHPVMLFLDDVQWADSTALELIHTILSDTMGSCMFFVGTYRDNEVHGDHNIFNLIEMLEISDVRTTKVSLTGLNREDLNSMISDALCLYPRICKPLSDIVFQKTTGNPFFVMEFMQSLQARGLLQYNSRQKRWVWDDNIIRAENITDNVLQLLSSKMMGLSGNVQKLLKVMACFGRSTNESVIGYLSESAEYAGVRNGLEGALLDGFIAKDGEGYLKFVHDKVHEAAYNLIPAYDKKQSHYDLGKVLYSICDGEDVEDTIFIPIANQINYGKEWISKDTVFSIAVAELNMKAGKKAIDGCDFRAAYSYLGTAISLLPEGHWESHYDLSLRLNFLMASAANYTEQYEKAELVLRNVFEKARCLEDKLPSYLLLTKILLSQGNPKGLYDTCVSAFSQLGVTIPSSVTPEAASTTVAETLTMYEEMYCDEWINKRLQDKKICTIAKIYNLFVVACFLCKETHIVAYHMCKAVQLSLQNGACQYTPLALIHFVGYAMKNESSASRCRIAKNALSMLTRFDIADQYPLFFLNYYGRVAWRFEPLQECADKLRRAFEAALSLGHVDSAFYCSIHVIVKSIFSGASLRSILKEIDYYLHLLKTYKSEVSKTYMLIYRETVSLLIDGQTTSIEATPCVGDLNDPGNKLRESALFHKACQSFWAGHTQRCRYYNEKCAPILGPLAQLTTYLAKFYHGLNTLDLVTKKCCVKGKEVVRTAIAAMTAAADSSDWNFTNKLLLLQAEQQSRRQTHRKAIPMYEDSIESARKSGFIHEQGLACEKAAFYFKKAGKNYEKAQEYFEQARECYEKWGSGVKVDFIQKELDCLKSWREREGGILLNTKLIL